MVGLRYDAPHYNHSDKGNAIRVLTGDNRFTKDIDYKVFTQNGKNPTEGRSTNESISLHSSGVHSTPASV